MATYLLKWDPTKWDWHNIAELAQAVSMGVPVSKPWSCGMARRITAGDRVFLIRQGREPRGLVASGHVTRGSYEAPHLEAQDSGRSKKGTLFIDVRFDVLAEPRREALLPRSRLNENLFSSFVWDIQASGVQIPDNISGELEKVWFVRAHPEEAAKQREAEERREHEERDLAEREAAAQRAAEEKAKEEARLAEEAKVAEQARREEETRLEKEALARKKVERKQREQAEQEAQQEAKRRAAEEERKRLIDEKRAAEQQRARAQEAENARAEKQRAEQAHARQIRAQQAQTSQDREAARPQAAAPASALQAAPASGPWSMKECAAVTEDYFLMLQAETIGKLYSKADHRNRLSKEINRSPETIEDYYRGVSAILGALGMPFIDTYKPAALDDAQLEAAIQTFIEGNPDRIESLWIEDAAQVSIPVELDDSKAFWVAAPSPAGLHGLAHLNWSPMIDTEVDFRKREARNYNLAMAGERFVLAYERARLREAGGKDLLDNIEWTSQNHGTDPGYDVKSFNEKGEDRFISVKATNFGPRFPFALSVDEIAFSRQYPGQFALYRVFNFAKGAKLFMLEGKLEDRLSLNPVVYRATL